MKKETRIEIFGSSYNIRSETDEEYIHELAAYVDTKMREITEQSGALSSLKVAILAALNITNELFQMREQHSQQSDFIEEKTAKLISILDNRLERREAQEKIA